MLPECSKQFNLELAQPECVDPQGAQLAIALWLHHSGLASKVDVHHAIPPSGAHSWFVYVTVHSCGATLPEAQSAVDKRADRVQCHCMAWLAGYAAAHQALELELGQ